MNIKNFVVVLLAFCTSLLLGFGVSIIFGVAGVQVCTETFCYAIKDFIQFYRNVFFTFGVMLTVITIFGLLALIWENKKMLSMYAKLLIFTLLIVFLILWLGIWAKGPIQLRSSLIHTFKMYDRGNCRVIKSVDQLQSQFKCCGIDKPEDWSNLHYPSIFDENSTSLEPPLSCCNAHLLFQKDDAVHCLTTYSRGCFVPMRRYVWRFFSIVTLVYFAVAIKITIAIIGVYKLINIIESNPRLLISQQNLMSSAAVAPINVTYTPENFIMKNATSSTAV